MFWPPEKALTQMYSPGKLSVFPATKLFSYMGPKDVTNSSISSQAQAQAQDEKKDQHPEENPLHF
jgi:hypothetical protein